VRTPRPRLQYRFCVLNVHCCCRYSDKEVFIREIVSNASDALEKLRLADLQQGADASGSALSISVTCDEAAGTLTVTDSGIGMSKDELVQCLGTIASSGTRSLVDKLKGAGDSSATSLIGKFGVGFYSVFMTCDSVRVTTRRRDASTGYLWSSDGSGTYSIQEAADAAAGTSVCMVLRPDCKTFAQTDEVQRVLLKYSNFINFPVHLNGTRINTIDAIWTKDKASISDDDHIKFFQFIADTSDMPAARLHFTVDAPIDIRALLYTAPTPSTNTTSAARA
jgi:TNF receptor-associated protein 1